MKLIIVVIASVVGIVLGGRLDTSYLPPRPGGGYSGGGGGYSGGAGGYSGSGSFGPQIPILRYDADNDGTGNYHYAYETGNGIQAEERGQLRNAGSNAEAVAAAGSFSYTGPDGQKYSIQYTADENGFRPVGAHLPTPPPIPDAILKSLEQNRAEEARGGYNNGGGDDGQYRPSNSYGPPASSYNPSSGYRY